jgi:hypothetical protein
MNWIDDKVLGNVGDNPGNINRDRSNALDHLILSMCDDASSTPSDQARNETQNDTEQEQSVRYQNISLPLTVMCIC